MKRRSNKNEQLGNIWDVVSSLAQALTDARDQLVGLINYPGTKGTRSAGNDTGFRHSHGKENIYYGNDNGTFHHDGNTLARYRGGGYIPMAKEGRSIHRQHARGHVAFGAHSEFKPQPPCKPCKPERGGSCPRGKPGKKGMQFGIYLDPKSNTMQISTKKGGGNPVKINFGGGGQSPEPQYACNKNANCRPSSPDSKRHCIGTQYAALLKEEAFRIRERRLAEEKDPNAKPKWTRC